MGWWTVAPKVRWSGLGEGQEAEQVVGQEVGQAAEQALVTKFWGLKVQHVAPVLGMMRPSPLSSGGVPK